MTPATAAGRVAATPGPVATETTERLDLPGGPLDYVLRRSRRARRLRLVVDPRRGVVVTIPAGRPGARAAATHVEAFLRERETWLRGHLARQASDRGRVADATPGSLVDGAPIRFRGDLHRLRIELAAPGARRSSVLVGWSERAGRELVVRVARPDRRPLARVIEAWLRGRAVVDIEGAVAAHADALGVAPAAIAIRDPRTRWGSAAGTGRLAFSWRLVLAPPEALETVVVHELAHLRVFGHGPAFWAVVASRIPDHAAWRRWLRVHSVELHAALAAPPDVPG